VSSAERSYGLDWLLQGAIEIVYLSFRPEKQDSGGLTGILLSFDPLWFQVGARESHLDRGRRYPPQICPEPQPYSLCISTGKFFQVLCSISQVRFPSLFVLLGVGRARG
jgi:hypothetical protein